MPVIAAPSVPALARADNQGSQCPPDDLTGTYDGSKIAVMSDSAKTSPIAIVPQRRRSSSQNTEPKKATAASAMPHQSMAGDVSENSTARPSTTSKMMRKNADGTSWRGMINNIKLMPKISRSAKVATASGILGQ